VPKTYLSGLQFAAYKEANLLESASQHFNVTHIKTLERSPYE
jgi:hypothetical protein